MKHYKTYRGDYTKRREKIYTISALIVGTILALTSLRVANAIIDMPKTNPYGEDTQEVELINQNEPTTNAQVEADIETLTDEMSVKERIIKVAKESNFKYTDYLVKLAYCESRLNEKATNTIGNSAGIDRGVFQINSYYQPQVSDADAFNVEKATKFAIEKINKGGQKIWACDRIVKGKSPKQLGYNY